MELFNIPARGDGVAEDELSRFFRSYRVLIVRREFVTNGYNLLWA